MSLPSSDDASVGSYRKPGPDLYTVLLLVAFLALTIGAVFLYLEGAEYGPTPNGEPNVQTSFTVPRHLHGSDRGAGGIELASARPSGFLKAA